MRALFLGLLILTVACQQSNEARQDREAEQAKVPSAPKPSSKPKARPSGSSPSHVVPVTPAMLANLDPWRNISDAQLQAELDAAYALAKSEDKRILLDFGASWCHDCVEVVRVLKEVPASTVLKERFVYVPINVGRMDRAKALTEKYGVKRIATLVVLNSDGTRVAQSTLEPISSKKQLTPQALAAWLAAPSDEASPLH